MDQAFFFVVGFTFILAAVELLSRSGASWRDCLRPESLPYFALVGVAHSFTTLLAFGALTPIALGSLEGGRSFLAAIFGVFAGQTVLHQIRVPVFNGEPDFAPLA